MPGATDGRGFIGKETPLQQVPRRELSLFDSTCLIVGIIIGAGIYEVAPTVAQGTSTWWGFLAIWGVGGLISLCGALGYAELATAFPQQGGDYVYLGRAYGRPAGFLFGWMQLAIVRPGDIAGMAFIFATYIKTVWDPWATPLGLSIYAAVAVAVLTLINVLGVSEGKWTQNVLTCVKVLGLLAVVTIAFSAPASARPVQVIGDAPLSLALILVLFTFGGWNEMAYVAAEVKNPNRNIVRALVLGTVAVTMLYLLVNGAFLYALGLDGIANSEAVAADAVAAVFPRIGGNLIAALVCVSALGATNGLIFAGARISYAMGADHAAFRPLGKWHPRKGTPARALLLQGLLAIVLIFLLGSFVNAVLYTAAAVYSFYLATSLAVIVLRFREPHIERPYRVTGYPLPTLFFCVVCGFLIQSAVVYKPNIALAALGILLLGLPVYLISNRFRTPTP